MFLAQYIKLTSVTPVVIISKFPVSPPLLLLTPCLKQCSLTSYFCLSTKKYILN